MASGVGSRRGAEEYDHYLELRRHLKRMQAGTPLLLRTGPEGGGAQEDLRICTFWVTQDLQSLQWREQEGDGPGCEVREVRLSEVAEAVVDNSREEDDDHHALTVVLQPGACKDLPGVLGLICASPEDLATWHQGLKFLLSSSSTPQPPPAQLSESLAAEQARESETSAGNNLKETLREQLEMNDKLRKENELLREVVKRKDTTIAMLLRDLQRGATVGASSGKTESTSRESDEHLRFREVAILRRKNRRLQKALRGKQQTVSDLLSIVGRVSAQQAIESSAPEEVDDEDLLSDGAQSQSTAAARAAGRGRRAAGSSEDAEEEAAPLGKPRAAAASSSARFEPSPTAAAASAAASASAAAATGVQAREPAPCSPTASTAASARSPTSSSRPVPATAAQSQCGVPTTAAPPAAAGGSSSIAGGLPAQQLLQLAASMGLAGAGASPGAANATAAAAAAAAAATSPRAMAGMGSAAALEALAKEMQKLEEKKRVVEQLAKRLEPPSEEEDDGFPLR